MSGVTLTASSVVRLHPLHFGEEQGGELEIGRPETGVFVSLGPEGVALLRWLEAGEPLAEVGRRFEAAFGADPDIVDFVRELSGCGFVLSVDGEPLPTDPVEQAARDVRGWRLLGNLPRDRVAWLLTPPALLAYLVIWCSLLGLLLAHPGLRPSPDDAFLDLGVLGNLVVLTGLGWLLLFLHEVAHLVAVRARGCEASVDISHRLHFLVAQTDMTSVRALPRRARYAPYLAGMTWDATLLLLVLLLDLSGFAVGLSRAAAYLLLMSLLFELAVFLRTDLYYVLTNALRLGSLTHDARRWVVNLACRVAGAPARHDLGDVPAREMLLVRWYAVAAAAGVAVTVGQFVLLGLPLLAAFVHESALGLGRGAATGAFWSSVGVLAVVAAQFGLLAVAAVRERRRRRARSEQAVAGRTLIEDAETSVPAAAPAS